MVSDLCWVGKKNTLLRSQPGTRTSGKGSQDAGRSRGLYQWSPGVPVWVTRLVLGTPKPLTALMQVQCWLAWVCDPTGEGTRTQMGAITDTGLPDPCQGCWSPSEGSCQILLPSP